MRSIVQWAISGILFLSLIGPTTVFAEEDAQKTALARSLFRDGVALMESEQWEAAADKLERALKLRSSSVIAYNLGFCLSHTGKLVRASELLERVIRDDTASEDLKDTARLLLQEINPRIAKLMIRAQGDLSNTEITLDDRVLSQVEIGVATPVDPGRHVVIARRNDVDVADKNVEVAEGITIEVVLEIPTPAVREATQTKEAAPSTIVQSVSEKPDEPTLSEPTQPAKTNSGKQSKPTIGLWTWVTLGSGAVALSGAVAFEFIRKDAEHEASQASQIDYREKLKTMKQYQTTARVFLGAGAALSVIGSVLLVLDIYEEESKEINPRFGIRCNLRGCTGITRGTF